ncbi:MAG: LysR family transcriptional regulator [Lachnospiraceae bacterium]|jgi:DNA-binding transcriptional LysR family regulator|nr:LysR family transcriptional regulator [Lachnospiraceae bacterium]
MDEYHIHYIQAIEREGSIQKAAGVLGKNPSTLARVLKNCEREMEVSFFNRTRGRMVPTPEGEHLLALSREILEELERIEKDGEMHQKRQEGQRLHQWRESEIRYLLAIREKKNISQAAKELYIAQPSLSQILKALEEDLGHPVFWRNKNGVEETGFGSRLLDHLEIVKRQYDRLGLELEEFHEMKRGRITLGIPLNLGTYLLPAVIPPFRERFPGIRIRIRENNSNELEQLMIAKKIDFCILHFHERREQVQYEMFFDDPFYLVIPQSFQARLSLPEKRPLTREDFQRLKEESFVMVSPRQKLRLVADRILKNAGLVPDICCTTKSMETAKRLVAAEMGVTLLPGSYLNLYSGVEGLACYSLEKSLEGVWKLAVAYPKDEKLPRSSREFLSVVQELLYSKFQDD